MDYSDIAIKRIASRADFPDKRLNLRLEKVLTQLNGKLQTSIPSAIGERSQVKGCYRFLSNEAVTDKALAQVARQESVEAVADQDWVLALQDTTTLDFTGKRSAAELDCLSYAHQKGYFLHSQLLATAQGEVKGVFSQRFFNRSLESLGKAKERRHQPIESKESYRWVEDFEDLQAAFAPAIHQQVLLIADREGDIHELLQARQYGHIHYLIRSAHPRICLEGQSIWQSVEEQAASFSYALEVEQAEGKTRIAHLEVRYQALQLRPGYRPKDQTALQAVCLWVIQAKEVNPAKGESPLCWCLLTDLAVLQGEMAERLLRFYSYRWRIERFHYLLKQGCQIEQLQLKAPQALQKAIRLYSWLAWKVLQSQHYLQAHPLAPLEKIGVNQQDYQRLGQVVKATKKKNLSLVSQPTLGHFVELIALLGGSMGWKNKPIGVVCLWKGWKDFLLLRQAWMACDTCG